LIRGWLEEAREIDCAAPHLIAAQAPGIGSMGITSMASPGKIVKCG
jgi:hypothetical protein